MVKTARTLAIFFGLLLSFFTQAQQNPNKSPGNTAATAVVRPQWKELSPKQQYALAPLMNDWEKMDANRRQKWLNIAIRYPKMSPEEQSLLKTRMQEWANLSTEQRRVAREKYQKLKQLPDPQRQEISQKWQQQTTPPVSDSAPAPAITPAPIETKH